MEDVKFQAMLMRIASVTKSTKPKDLAPILGISPAAVSKALTQQRIPETWVNTLVTKYNLTHDWLKNGDASAQAEAEKEPVQIREEKRSMHLTLLPEAKEALFFQILGSKEQTIEAHKQTIESQEREIRTLAARVQSLEVENAELKARLSLFTAADGNTPQASTA